MAKVEQELQADAYSGHLYVFLSRRCDRVKILTFDQGVRLLQASRARGFPLAAHGPEHAGGRDRRDAALDAASLVDDFQIPSA